MSTKYDCVWFMVYAIMRFTWGWYFETVLHGDDMGRDLTLFRWLVTGVDLL